MKVKGRRQLVDIGFHHPPLASQVLNSSKQAWHKKIIKKKKLKILVVLIKEILHKCVTCHVFLNRL